MKCPRTFVLVEVFEGCWELKSSDCIKEECAWWLEDIQMCSIRDEALETRYIQLRLQDKVGKIPTGAQFRK